MCDPFDYQKSDTDAFLRSQGNYMLLRIPKTPRVNKPIEAEVANERWGVDMIDMSIYNSPANQRQWILVCVDYLSGEIRKVIRSGFIRNNNFQWTPFLAAYIENINSQRRAKSKQTRASLWRQGYTP